MLAVLRNEHAPSLAALLLGAEQSALRLSGGRLQLLAVHHREVRRVVHAPPQLVIGALQFVYFLLGEAEGVAQVAHLNRAGDSKHGFEASIAAVCAGIPCPANAEI